MKTVQTRLNRAHRSLRERLRARFGDRSGHWAPALLGFAGLPSSGASARLAVTTSTLLMKKLALTIASVLVLLVGWIAYRPSQGEPSALPVANPEVSAGGDRAGGREPLDLVRHSGEAERVAAAAEPDEARAPAAAGPERGSLRVQVLRADGTPAGAVHVVATLEHESVNLQRRFRERTDEEGFAFFSALPVASFSLECDRHERHGRGGIEVRRNETTEAVLTIPAGVRVVGRVSDTEGRPVANAGIWLTASSGGWTGGGIVAQSDESGTFEAPDVPPGQSIGAVADGFQPSSLVDLDLLDTRQSPVSVELGLARGGAGLRGVVRNETGDPVEGALVVVGDDSRSAGRRLDGTWEESWSPRATRTDREGRYGIPGLPAGERAVQVRSFEYAVWGAPVTLEAGRTAELDIALSRGATVRGTLTYPDGQVVPEGLVLAFREPQRNRTMNARQFGYHGPLMGPAAVADEDGAYELAQVAPGETWLYALEPTEHPGDRQDLVRIVSLQLDLAPDAEHAWNPVLSAGRVVEGRALYADGIAIENVLVTLRGPGPDDHRAFRTEDGHFRFQNLGPGPFTIRVQLWRRPEGQPEPSVGGVYPDGPAVELVAAYPAPKYGVPATVRVRLVDESGRTGDEGLVILVSSDTSSYLPGEREGDLWTFSVRDPGSYHALALHRERTVCTGPTVEVQAGEVVDLPDLVTEPAGTLVLAIERPEDPPLTGLGAFLRVSGSQRGEAIPLGGQSELSISNLEPGPGRISIQGDNVVPLSLDFELHPGEATHLVVPLTPAVPVPCQVEWGKEDPRGTLSIRFLERPGGSVAGQFDIEELSEHASPLRWSALLPLGSYTFEVTGDGRPYRRQDFEVTSLDPERAPKVGFE